MKVFFDTEFTGLHKDTTLISIGLINENGDKFYAELNDFNPTQIDKWLQENVINNLKFNHYDEIQKYPNSRSKRAYIEMKGNKQQVANRLKNWLLQFDGVEMWADCLAYDWVLFNDLFGHAFNIPENIYYIPFDICTLMKMKGVDPNVSREEFVGIKDKKEKHNALYDATVIRKCYNKLMDM